LDLSSSAFSVLDGPRAGNYAENRLGDSGRHSAKETIGPWNHIEIRGRYMMPDLTPEERAKISEKEKVRIETRNIGCGAVFIVLLVLLVIAALAILL
jgi:hypothetical protein